MRLQQLQSFGYLIHKLVLILKSHNIWWMMTIASQFPPENELGIFFANDVPGLGLEHLLYCRTEHANVANGMATVAHDDFQRVG